MKTSIIKRLFIGAIIAIASLANAQQQMIYKTVQSGSVYSVVNGNSVLVPFKSSGYLVVHYPSWRVVSIDAFTLNGLKHYCVSDLGTNSAFYTVAKSRTSSFLAISKTKEGYSDENPLDFFFIKGLVGTVNLTPTNSFYTAPRLSGSTKIFTTPYLRQFKPANTKSMETAVTAVLDRKGTIQSLKAESFEQAVERFKNYYVSLGYSQVTYQDLLAW